MKEDDTCKTIYKDDKISKTLTKFVIFQKSILESKFFNECCDALSGYATNFKRIRCLALGSPVESNSALYQFAFVLALGKFYTIDTQNITFYDPIFNDDDKMIIEEKYNCIIAEDPKTDRCDTLYFLPHASLEVTEEFINSKRPVYFLGNDLISHTDRLTKRKLHETYITLSLLVKKLEDKNIVKVEDGFVKAKPKKRRNRANLTQVPEISYNYNEAYFQDIISVKFKQMSDSWGNAFSDLAFHYIIDTKDV